MSFLIITWLLAALSILGVVLNIYKLRACFFIWAFTNATWAIVDFQKGIYAQAALFTVYFFLAVWGIIKWDKKKPRIDSNNESM